MYICYIQRFILYMMGEEKTAQAPADLNTGAMKVFERVLHPMLISFYIQPGTSDNESGGAGIPPAQLSVCLYMYPQ
jgi:hypothetical protein